MSPILVYIKHKDIFDIKKGKILSNQETLFCLISSVCLLPFPLVFLKSFYNIISLELRFDRIQLFRFYIDVLWTSPVLYNQNGTTVSHWSFLEPLWTDEQGDILYSYLNYILALFLKNNEIKYYKICKGIYYTFLHIFIILYFR